MIDNKLKLLFIWLLFLGLYHPAYAQFSLPSQVCPNQNVTFTSPNPSAAYHAWDFCPNDINLGVKNARNTSIDFAGSGINVRKSYEITHVFDGTNWFGFVSDQNFSPANISSTTIIRLNYGSSLTNTPTLTNLGNVDNALARPMGVAVIKANGKWYGLVCSIADSKIVRLDFGTSLTNTPTATAISDPGGALVFPTHIDVVKNGNKFIAVAANYNANLVIMDFGNDLESDPSITTTTNLPGSQLWSIKMLRGDDNNWYAVTVSVGPSFFGPIDINHINFGANFTNTPVITTLNNTTTAGYDQINVFNGAGASTTVGGGYDLELIRDGDKYYAFIVSNKDKVLKLDFGKEISDPTSTLVDMGDFNTINDTERDASGISMVKEGSDWRMFVVNQTGNPSLYPIVYRIDFDNAASCSNANTITPSSTNPTNSFTTSGKYYATLRTYDSDLNLTGFYMDSVTVESSLSANFNSTNYCVGQPTSFTNTSVITGGATIESWTWDFGDSSPTSNTTDAEHTYNIPGTYTVTLTPKSIGGSCDFPRTQIIRVRTIPEAKFSAPEKAGQNTTVSFVNNSVVEDEDSKTSYYWLFDDGTFSILKTPSHSFSNPGVYNVTLTVKDTTDGCAITYSKPITVGATPTVDFNLPSNACSKTPITFNNISSVSDNVGSTIVSYQWNFGGAGTSTEKNPTVTFDFASSYEISLTVTTNLGVTNTMKKIVSFQEGIQSIMQATSEVSGDAPLGVSFVNQTGNAVSYLWDFGDGTTSTDASPSHVFTQPGIYNVTFSAFGTNGCSIPVTQQVIVSASNTVTELGITNLRVQDDRLFVEITNNGNDPVISSNLKVVINGADTLTGQWTGVLNSLQTTEYAFDLQQGQGDMVSQACAEIIDVNAQQDAKTLNNRLCKDLLDAQVVNALVQDGNCIMWLKNNGQIPIKKLKIKLDFGDTSQEVEWTGTLNSNEQTNYIVALPMTESELAGKAFFCANVLQVNGTQDAVSTNNVACQEYGDQFQVLGISPNPAIDYISIDYFLPSRQDNDVVQLQIINSSGAVMGRAQLLNLIAGRNTYKYPTTQLGSGLYTLVFISGNRKVIKKIVIR